MRIFVCLCMNADEKDLLRADAGDADCHFAEFPLESDAARDAFNRAEVVFGNPPPKQISESPSLRWVQLESAGFGEYADLDWENLGPRVAMTNLAGFFEQPVAESALAGMLAFFRGVDRAVELKRGRRWLGDELRPSLRTLAGANVVLFGFGSINRRIAELLAPFQCNITLFRKDWAVEALDRALSEADVVAAAAPDTPQTRGVFSRERIQRINPEAVFLNFGRGSAVDEDALAEALETEHLRGAVIDVTQDEPLPAEHRFWSCPNMILTQHSAGGAGDEIRRKIRFFTDNLLRYRASKPLAAVVDMKRGY